MIHYNQWRANHKVIAHLIKKQTRNLPENHGLGHTEIHHYRYRYGHFTSALVKHFQEKHHGVLVEWDCVRNQAITCVINN